MRRTHKRKVSNSFQKYKPNVSLYRVNPPTERELKATKSVSVILNTIKGNAKVKDNKVSMTPSSSSGSIKLKREK